MLIFKHLPITEHTESAKNKKTRYKKIHFFHNIYKYVESLLKNKQHAIYDTVIIHFSNFKNTVGIFQCYLSFSNKPNFVIVLSKYILIVRLN